MKIITISFVFLAALLAGCTQNEIEIRNEAAAGVYFLFRGEQTYIPTGGSTSTSDIPNGTFDYSTTYEVPGRFSRYEAESDLAGKLNFAQNKTKVLLLYGSTSSDSVYSINLNLTTTNNQSTATSP